MHCVENKTFAELSVGDTASLTRTLTREDIHTFAAATGDMNPAHMDEAYAKSSVFHQIVGHGMWTASMFSVLLGMRLPGPGTIYTGQTLKFLAPVKIGDAVTASVTLTKKDEAHKRVTFKTLCINQDGKIILEGEAEVLPPTEKICWDIPPRA